MDEPGEITQYLSAARRGDRAALDHVFARVYGEVRRIAAAQVQRAGGESTLSTTSVVHEAYLKLAGSAQVEWADRGHFFAVAARAMRQVLLDHARSHLAQKRGGVRPLSLDDVSIAIDDNAAGIVEMDSALTRLSALDERLGQVVELRYYAGLTVEETATVLGVTDRTIKRDWQTARAFLHRELHGGER
ncbi:MAG: sigma-70 family RNA polymerase sigma factor [Candidatus Eisenbacteria bacterium]